MVVNDLKNGNLLYIINRENKLVVYNITETCRDWDGNLCSIKCNNVDRWIECIKIKINGENLGMNEIENSGFGKTFIHLKDAEDYMKNLDNDKDEKDNIFYYVECPGSRGRDAAELLRRFGGKGEGMISLDLNRIYYIRPDRKIDCCDVWSTVGMLVKEFYTKLELKEKMKLTKEEVAEIIGMKVDEFEIDG